MPGARSANRYQSPRPSFASPPIGTYLRPASRSAPHLGLSMILAGFRLSSIKCSTRLLATRDWRDGLRREAALSIPTPDHYLPLLYVLATTQRGDSVSFPVAGIDGGSISMLAV